jgi:NADP oxidoreductase coenzyme F420-dependent./Domain of unknown function (DUF2520).
MKSSRITLFGAGNLAINLAKALTSKGYKIIQVFSRTKESAEWLANKLDAVAITNPADFDHSTEVVIFALNDNALEPILQQIEFSGQLALHTSGSMPLDIFKGKAEHYGVLYPLQTFSKSRSIKFHEIPIFIEAGTSKDLANLKMLAESISARVHIADSLQRRQLHLSAIFANNFVNHFYTLAGEMIKKSGFSFDILKPIILETALKAIETDNPATVQTGPAVRMNKEIIEKHIEMLAYKPDLQNLYTFATNSISELHYNKTII